MGKRFEALTEHHGEFIARQKMFFVATASVDGRVNLSPKGSDSFRVLGPNRVVWLNLTGSGNETAAHLREVPRMTVMFCSFEGEPLILRLYGTARAIHPGEGNWADFVGLFPPAVGARQVIELDVDLVQTSCGFSVPLYAYQGERTLLTDWAERRGPEGIRTYWKEKNSLSLDGKPTGIEAAEEGLPTRVQTNLSAED